MLYPPPMLADLRASALSTDEVIQAVRHPGAGGIALFLGVVRETNDGHAVTDLVYSAYESMAKLEMSRLAEEIESEMAGVRTAVLHRIGALQVGDIAVICAASAPHRDAAFVACRALIDRIKERVPIWKKELGPEGAEWIGFRP